MTEQKERRLTVVKDNLYEEEHRIVQKVTPPEKFKNKEENYTRTVTRPDEYNDDVGVPDNVRGIFGDRHKRKLSYTDSPTINNSSGGLPDKTEVSDSSGYQTNPMYEKLLKYRQVQQKKRFTVDDLLKW